MTKHMFINSQNYWYPRIASLMSLFMLFVLLLETYIFTGGSFKEWIRLTQSFQPWIIVGMITLLTLSLGSLQNHFGYRPLVICVTLILFAMVEIWIDHPVMDAKNNPDTVFLHLFVCFGLFTLSWSLGALTHPKHSSATNNYHKYKLWVWLGICAILLQIISGAWVIANDAGHICNDLLLCQGLLLPTGAWKNLFSTPLNHHALVGINIIYKITAFFTTLYLLGLATLLIFKREFVISGILILIQLAIQIFLSVFLFIFTLPWISITKEAVTLLLFLTMLSLLHHLYRKPHQYW